MHEKMRICESGPGERALERSAHLGGWMVLGRAAPKVLERSRIVLLRAHALGIHVAQVREGRRLASGGSLRVVVKGLGRIGRQPACAVVVQVAEGELRVDRALERRVLIVLQHVVVRATLHTTSRIVDGEAHLFDGARAAAHALRLRDDALGDGAVVQERLEARLWHAHAEQVPVPHCETRATKFGARARG